MLDLIQRLRSRPVHVRRRVALATSAAVTAVVALVWVTASVALGAFSINTPAQTDVAADINNSFAAAQAQSASVFSSTVVATSSPAPASAGGLTVVQTKTTSSLVQVDPSTRTVIPF